ncbi:hypothetical protein ALO_21751 [Acetonema longum DSM 6540]|uniref:Uncharacterized protein n=1 Tax=Acetonema longum DSM 6540 TaxID=1009370 RepID=F7NQF1_9FIRM|nr:hypothetical protein ALO_21751 [Acetonema longum DSM 6540]
MRDWTSYDAAAARDVVGIPDAAGHAGRPGAGERR